MCFGTFLKLRGAILNYCLTLFLFAPWFVAVFSSIVLMPCDVSKIGISEGCHNYYYDDDDVGLIDLKMCPILFKK